MKIVTAVMLGAVGLIASVSPSFANLQSEASAIKFCQSVYGSCINKCLNRSTGDINLTCLRACNAKDDKCRKLHNLSPPKSREAIREPAKPQPRGRGVGSVPPVGQGGLLEPGGGLGSPNAPSATGQPIAPPSAPTGVIR